jgi:hypothetical protein
MADQTPDLANAGEREDRLTRCARCGTDVDDRALVGRIRFVAFWS